MKYFIKAQFNQAITNETWNNTAISLGYNPNSLNDLDDFMNYYMVDVETFWYALKNSYDISNLSIDAISDIELVGNRYSKSFEVSFFYETSKILVDAESEIKAFLDNYDFDLRFGGYVEWVKFQIK